MAAMASITPLNVRFQACSLHSRPPVSSFHLKMSQLKLSSSYSISSFGIRPILRQTRNDVVSLSPLPSRSSPPAIFAAKGYKMKTHKASAKRFRVTGSGKIMRRRAGKQHLLAKKNNKRKLRLSKSLGKLLSGVTIAHSGVLPNINLVLLPKKTAEKSPKEPKSPTKAGKSPKKA